MLILKYAIHLGLLQRRCFFRFPVISADYRTRSMRTMAPKCEAQLNGLLRYVFLVHDTKPDKQVNSVITRHM